MICSILMKKDSLRMQYKKKSVKLFNFAEKIIVKKKKRPTTMLFGFIVEISKGCLI